MSVFKKLSKTDENAQNQEYQCIVRFLDDSDPMQLSYKKDTIGQWLFEQVCNKLNLLEKDYFGLRYIDAEKQRHWLDPLKVIHKQLKGSTPTVLSFRVKFYPDDPMKLREELTRYFLFLQLRRDLQHGRLLCTPNDANILAAYIIQSEVGEYDPEDHPEGYVAEFKMLPKQTEQMEAKISEIHKTLAGQTPSDAEAAFLKRASNLNTYGVDPHQVRDTKGTQLYLGITHQGILTFQGNRKTHQFKWNQLRRIAYEGKMFIVHVYMREPDEMLPSEKASSLEPRGYLCSGGGTTKHHTIGFKCSTTNACRYLWKCAVEQQFFFTLQASNDPPKVRSNKHFFIRGSKFRFSGRCLKEVYAASDNILREEPPFTRSASHPTLSRNASTLKKTHHNTSLPSDMISEENAVDVPNTMATVESRPEGDKPPPPDVVVVPCTPATPDDAEPVFDACNTAPDITMTTVTPTMTVPESPKLSLSDESFVIPETYQPNLTPPIDESPIVKRVRDKKDLDSQIAELERQWSNHAAVESNHVTTQESAPPATKQTPSSSGVKTAALSIVAFVFLMLVASMIVVWYFDIDTPFLEVIQQHAADVVSGITRAARKVVGS